MVEVTASHEFLMCTVVDDATLVHDQNAGGELDDRQPMGDEECKLASGYFIEVAEDFIFMKRIDRRGGFVQYHQVAILSEV